MIRSVRQASLAPSHRLNARTGPYVITRDIIVTKQQVVAASLIEEDFIRYRIERHVEFMLDGLLPTLTFPC